ncbi:hypothetical protein [Aquamicrobium sp. LC103]|uniref:hypothetical protein n=1 Tax=Aquamicrobium sp. LC103 TaxID=1120658 RepID=UPI00063E8A77|nr:hypothetical protein [Aquamicrobium sp. LC103]TKT76334.1 hypothetical protein XW59_017350 [Aquamicrobium sp. LC103]
MRRNWLSWLGYLVLVAALPLAALGATLDANEYRAMGIEAVDCDGPLSVLIFAVPAFLIYGAGMAANARHTRSRGAAVVAVVCGLVCVALAVNIASAISEGAHQECSSTATFPDAEAIA